MKVRLDDASVAMRATRQGSGDLPETALVSTDTRTLHPGDLFVALRGERFDGHDYAAQALHRGACAAVVAHAERIPADAVALLVADTLDAYYALAALARRALSVPVVAITGSAGKTTTKALLAQLLTATGLDPVAVAPGNENNEFGVPKLLLAADERSRAVVVEMGARHYRELEPLVALARPDVAVLTNAGEAHLEIFGSRERLVETKFGIFAGGALPVLNRDDAVSRERAATLDRAPVWFAARDVEPSPDEFAAGERALIVVGRVRMLVREPQGWCAFPIVCGIAGDHNLRNLAAALAAAWATGRDAEALAHAVSSLELPPGRYERRTVGDFEVIYDAYNASPSGMLATLGSFAREPAARRIAVLGSMAELGPDAAAFHVDVGAAAARARLDALLVGGDHAVDLARGAREAGIPPERVIPFASNAAALDWLRAHARAGDVILLKASRRYKFEEILAGLEAVHA